MRGKFRLFLMFTVASLITTTAYFGLVLAVAPVLNKSSLPRGIQALGLVLTVLTPIVAGAWWITKKLREDYPQRIARAVAIAFVIFTPVSLGVAVLFSTLIGAYAEGFGGQPLFGLAGAFLGIVILIALLSFMVCSFVMWITRRTGALEQHDSI
jgi:hypothetical protein